MSRENGKNGNGNGNGRNHGNGYGRNGNGVKREEMIIQHLPYVEKIAKRFNADRLGMQGGDMIGAGAIGLIDATDKFDPSLGVPFKGYAKIRIRGAMLDEVRSMDWVPRLIREKFALIEKARFTACRRLGRDPAEVEVADELGISLEEYFEAVNEVRGVMLTEDIFDIAEESQEDSLAIPPDQFEYCYWSEIRMAVLRAMRGLLGIEKYIILRYYYGQLTMKEIGDRLGYTQSRISQLHSKAIAKLRTILERRLRPDDLPDGFRREVKYE